jgi:hypothetical protein
LRGDAEPGLDVPELPVAVRGLVEVHEVHVDRRPRQRGVGLGVQVQQRLAQRVQPGDPHLRRGEGVHPGDDADAGRVGVGLEHRAADRAGVGEHRLPDHPDRAPAGLVERGGDPLGLLGDLLQGLLAVQPLAAGEEPDLGPANGWACATVVALTPHCP